MQILWAKVLAGEVKRPGSTSVRTLGILRDMDAGTARLFATLCSACTFWGQFSSGRMHGDARVVSLGGNAAMNCLQEIGLRFGVLNRLNEQGLIISDCNSGVNHQARAFAEAKGSEDWSEKFMHQGQWRLLEEVEPWPASKELLIHGVALTVCGRELSMVVGQKPMPEYTAKLKEFYRKERLRMVPVAEAASGS